MIEMVTVSQTGGQLGLAQLISQVLLGNDVLYRSIELSLLEQDTCSRAHHNEHKQFVTSDPIHKQCSYMYTNEDGGAQVW